MNDMQLDYIVMNSITNQSVAAFMLPHEALSYIRDKAVRHGADALNLYMVNADGSPLSAYLERQVLAARCNKQNLMRVITSD